MHALQSDTRSFAGVFPALGQVLVAVLAALVLALQDSLIDGPEIVNAVVLGLGAVVVFLVPLLPSGIGQYTKVGASVLTAAALVLASALTDGITSTEWLQIILAGFGAVGIAVGPTKLAAGHDDPAATVVLSPTDRALIVHAANGE